MTLRSKILIVTSATLIGLVTVLYFVSYAILQNSFSRLEEDETREKVQRVLAALSDEVSQVNSVAGDWAPWDDAYAFVQDGNQNFIDTNLVDNTFVNLRLSLIIFVDSSGRMVYGKAFDFQNNHEIAIPQALLDQLANIRSNPLLSHSNAESSVAGIFMADSDSPILIASRPILTSNGTGPIRGTLIVGRFLDSSEIAQLARLTHLQLSVLHYDAADLSLSGKTPILVRAVDDKSISGYALINDVLGKPALVLAIQAARSIHQSGQTSLTLLLSSLLIAGLAFVVMTLVLWDRLALTRLTGLSRGVSAIGMSGDFSARVEITGRDELSNVGSEINRMLEALQRSTKALRESEERFRQQAAEFQRLYEISLRLNAPIEISELLRVIVEQAIELLNARTGLLNVYDSQRDEPVLSLAVSLQGEAPGRNLRPGERLAGKVFESRRTIAVEDSGVWSRKADVPGQDRSIAELSVPLLGTHGVLGELIIAAGERPFAEHDIRLVELFAAQAAAAMERAQLHAEAQRRARELAALNKAGQAILATLDLQAALESVIAEVRALLVAEGTSVLLHDAVSHELIFAAADGPNTAQLVGTRMPDMLGVAGWVVQERKAVLARDVHSDPRFYRQIDEATGLITRSLMAAPLISKGVVTGVIEVVNKTDGIFDQHDLDMLEAMANSAAIATENAQLYKLEKEQRELAETLREVSSTLVSTVNQDTVLDRLLEQVSRVVPNDEADIMLIDGSVARVARWRSDDHRAVSASITGTAYPIDDIPTLRQLAETGEPVVISDTRADMNWLLHPGYEWLHSYAGVPIRVRGKVIGFLSVNSAIPNFYRQVHAHRLHVFADQVAIALENARLFDEERKAADRLQALSRRLVEMQEAERSRVARELHDEAGQTLTSMMISLRLLEQDADHPEVVVSRAVELKRMTSDVLEGLHRLAVDLRPASLDHVGLPTALHQLVQTFSRQFGLRIQFMVEGLEGERLMPETETALYRIVQEALTNVARHAHASKADVILERRGDRVVAIVEDDGIGFDPEAYVQRDRLGLLGIRERVEMLDGTLVIESEIGGGTTVLVEVPYVHSYSSSG